MGRGHRCTYTHTRAHIRTHAYTHRYTHGHVHAHTHRYTHTHTQIHAHTHACKYTCTHTHTYTDTCTHTHRTLAGHSKEGVSWPQGRVHLGDPSTVGGQSAVHRSSRPPLLLAPFSLLPAGCSPPGRRVIAFPSRQAGRSQGGKQEALRGRAERPELHRP